MLIKVQDVRRAAKKIGFEIVDGENLEFHEGECCPIAAICLQNKWDQIQKDLQKAEKKAKKQYEDFYREKPEIDDDWKDFFEPESDSKILRDIKDGNFDKHSQYSKSFISGFIDGFDDDLYFEYNKVEIFKTNKEEQKHKDYLEGLKNGKHIRRYLIDS